jgi:hypothetical protein
MPTESQIPERELLLRVRQRIDDGRLPVAMPSSICSGYGTGADLCQVCDQQITAYQVMYEVSDPRRLLFHLGCYEVWHRECAKRIAAG